MSKRMLIVDDALIMRTRIREIAETAGWEVVGEALNGVEAVAMYRQHRPDLVTLDIVMPEVDGVDALRRIRAMDAEAQVVMITAVNQREKLAACIEHGAVDFIVKPFDPQRLGKLFARYLSA